MDNFTDPIMYLVGSGVVLIALYVLLMILRRKWKKQPDPLEP